MVSNQFGRNKNFEFKHVCHPGKVYIEETPKKYCEIHNDTMILTVVNVIEYTLIIYSKYIEK